MEQKGVCLLKPEYLFHLLLNIIVIRTIDSGHCHTNISTQGRPILSGNVVLILPVQNTVSDLNRLGGILCLCESQEWLCLL